MHFNVIFYRSLTQYLQSSGSIDSHTLHGTFRMYSSHPRLYAAGPADSLNSVTANQIEAFQQLTKERKCCHSQSNFAFCIMHLFGSWVRIPLTQDWNHYFTQLCAFINKIVKYNNTLQLQSIWNVCLAFLDFKKAKYMNKLLYYLLYYVLY